MFSFDKEQVFYPHSEVGGGCKHDERFLWTSTANMTGQEAVDNKWIWKLMAGIWF